MEIDSKPINIKGVKTPNFKETKGEKYSNLLKKLRVEFVKVQSEVSKARTELQAIEMKIRKLKKEIDSKDVGTKQFKLKKELNQLKKKIEPLEKVAYKDLTQDRNKILNNEELKAVRAEAFEEHKVLRKQIEEYEQHLEEAYRKTQKDINRFMADYQSDSKFREADVKLNKLKG